MTKANEFVSAVQRQRRSTPESVDEFLKRQHAAWLSDLVQLQLSITSWMNPVVSANAATVHEKSFSITEPDLGTYDAPGLEISLLTEPLQVVNVRPRGLRISGIVETGGNRVVGASGRVDMECGASREIILRFRQAEGSQWCSYGGGSKRVLDEELFFELLAKTAVLQVTP
jgi:hypothetical protein